MKFGVGIQQDKNISFSPIDIFVEKMNQYLSNNRYGQIDDVVIGIICVNEEIKHLFPERKTKVNTAKGYLDMEISFQYSFVMEASESDIVLAFVQKVESKLLLAKSKYSEEIIDSKKMIEDIKTLLPVE